MFRLFGNRNSGKPFFAGLTSQLGSVIGKAPFVLFLVHQFSIQPQYVSLRQMMMTIPSLVLFVVIGVVADRIDRQKISIWADFLRGLLTLDLLLGALTRSIPVMFSMLPVREAVGNFFDPAQAGLLQGILSSDEYTLAVGLEQTQMSLFMWFGTSLGVLVYWALGIGWAISFAAVIYGVPAIMLTSCDISEQGTTWIGYYSKDAIW